VCNRKFLFLFTIIFGETNFEGDISILKELFKLISSRHILGDKN